MFFTFVSIPTTIAINSSKVFVTSRPATILEGLADIDLFVVDSESNKLYIIKSFTKQKD